MTKSKSKQETTATTVIETDIPTVPDQIRGNYLGNTTSRKQRIFARAILIATPILIAIYALIKAFILQD